MRTLALIAGAALAVSACSTVHTLAAAPSTTLQRSIYAASNDFAAILPVAIAYENLPRCGTAAAANAVCSKPDVVTKITAAARTAKASLDAAQAAARSPNNLTALETAAINARGAVSAFRTLVEDVQK